MILKCSLVRLNKVLISGDARVKLWAVTFLKRELWARRTFYLIVHKNMPPVFLPFPDSRPH